MTLITDAPVFPIMTLRIEAWPDPVIDDLGHDPRSSYVERFWLPVLGPSTVWFLRQLADGLDSSPGGFDLDLVETARSLGVGMRGGKHSPMLRTVDRACRFGASRMIGTTGLAVRRRLAPLTRAQAERLPSSLQRAHGEAMERPRPSHSALDLQERARSLALSMLDLGEEDLSIERQLHRWRFHPSMAHEALRWAKETRSASPTQPGMNARVGVGPNIAMSSGDDSVRMTQPSRRVTHVDRPRIGAGGIAVRNDVGSSFDEAG
jgi:hypothetical protein